MTLHLGGGRNMIVENNITINSARGFHYDNRGEGWSASVGKAPTAQATAS